MFRRNRNASNLALIIALIVPIVWNLLALVRQCVAYTQKDNLNLTATRDPKGAKVTKRTEPRTITKVSEMALQHIQLRRKLDLKALLRPDAVSNAMLLTGLRHINAKDDLLVMQFWRSQTYLKLLVFGSVMTSNSV